MKITKEQLSWYRAQTFRTAPGLKLKSAEEAVEYVNQRGFIHFWPVKNILMPSLWVATAGDRPVPDEHDDPGHITWDWKDRMLGRRSWYYGRVLRKRNTFISLEYLPNFYALSPNYGDPNEDYLIDYEQGRLALPTKLLYEALLKEGPLDSIALRKSAGLTSRGSDSEFNHALDELQTTFRILPVGISEAGAWHYSFVYDLVARHFPSLPEKAHPISEPQARQTILMGYLNSVGAVPLKEIQRVFCYQPMNWSKQTIERDLLRLRERGELDQEIEVEGEKELCLASKALLSA